MSLISEALKEAQKSHSQRVAPKGAHQPAPATDAFFPYPEGRKPARSTNVPILIGGIAVAVLVIGGAVLLRARRRPPVVVPPTSVAALPPRVPTAAPSPVTVAPPTAASDSAAHVTTAPASPAGSSHSGGQSTSPAGSAGLIRPQQSAAAPVAAAPGAVADSRSVAHAEPGGDSATGRSGAARTPPALPPSQSATAGVHVVVDAVSSRPGDSLFKQAFAEQSRGNFEHSKELYEKAIALPQAPAEAFNDYGVLLLQGGNQLGASEMFKQALKRDDKNVDAWVNLGDSYNAIGHHAEAMAAFARAGQLDASSVAVKTRLAAEYEAIGDTAVARRMYDDAARTAPKDASVHYNFGKFLQAQRDYRGAIREYQLFVDLAPGKYSADNIAMIRQYIVTLGRYVR